MVLRCGGCGAHQGTCRPSVNNDSTSKMDAKHCIHVWTGLGYCFVEGVELTKASVDHLSIMIIGQKTRPSSAVIKPLQKNEWH